MTQNSQTQADSRDPLSIAQQLIRRPSVTPLEAGTLDYLQQLLEPAGFTCHRLTFSEPGTPDVDNLYARIGTDAPHICFAGHVDVVPPGDETRWSAPPFAAELRDGKLYGRGAADMKGGIAAFAAAALAHLSDHDGRISGSISLLITGDEEGPSINGTVKMLQWAADRGETFDHCIVGEPTNPAALGDMIKIGRRGSLSGTLTVHGKQGHVGYPHLADNPIAGMVRLISALLAEPLDRGNDAFQPSNLEFTTLDVGNPAGNVIPAEAVAKFNIRFNNQWTAVSLEAHLRNILEAAARRNEGAVHYTLDCEPSNADAFLTQPGAFTDLVSAAVEKVTGRKPDLSTTGGTSDARFIKNYCPVVEFGLAGGTMHQIDEHILVSDLYGLTDIYRQILRTYLT